ncbi:MAG: PIN domain-containing protein [Chloroflexi bacterium]|nr:MAG: hypothetical protein CUN54_07135 [Phototrophicales bacterium]RMF82591.1 MAG: PIN domain-containing protein [Chloroflexota bacterium]
MIRAFLDASALFSGIRSASGATRELFKWHLRGELQLIVSAYAVDECIRNLAEDFPDRVGAVEIVLDFLQPEEVNPTPDEVRQVAKYTTAKDAPIVAAALKAECSHLLTFDRKDLIDPPHVAKQSGLIILTPGDLLQQLRTDA